MISEFFKTGTVYSLAKSATGLSYLVLLPLYTRSLSTTEYGVMDTLMLVAAFFQVIAALEIGQALARETAELPHGPERSKLVSSVVIFALIAYTMAGAAIALFASAVSSILFGSTQFDTTVRVAALSMAAFGVYTLLQNQLRYELRPVSYLTASVTYAVGLVILTWFFTDFRPFGLMGVFLAQAASAALAGAVALFQLRTSVRATFSTQQAKRMLAFSAPIALSAIASLLALYMDRVVVRAMLPLSDLGIYAVGARVASIVVFLTVGFQVALTPLIYARHERRDTPAQLDQLLRTFLAMVLPLVLVLAASSPEVVAGLTNADFRGAGDVVFMLSLAVVSVNLYMFAPGLWLVRKTRQIALVSVIAVSINFAIQLIMVGSFGLVGAAWASVISGITTFGITVWRSQPEYRIPYRWSRIALGFVAAVLGGTAITFALRRVDPYPIELRMAIALMASILVILIELDSHELKLVSAAAMRKLKRLKLNAA